MKKKSKNYPTRATELEKVQNNIRVLSEMLIHFNHSTVTDAEKETMTVSTYLSLSFLD